jgi:hypothetical protein
MPFISTSYDYDALIDEYGMQSFNLQYYRYDYFICRRQLKSR